MKRVSCRWGKVNVLSMVPGWEPCVQELKKKMRRRSSCNPARGEVARKTHKDTDN
jgi:hypothetical protein